MTLLYGKKKIAAAIETQYKDSGMLAGEVKFDNKAEKTGN